MGFGAMRLGKFRPTICSPQVMLLRQMQIAPPYRSNGSCHIPPTNGVANTIHDARLGVLICVRLALFPITWAPNKHLPTMNILDALEVLRTAPDSLLLSHSAQTISTLRNVGARLKTDLLMPAAGVEEPTEHTLNPSCRKRKRKSRTPSGPVDGIIQGLPQAISCLLDARGRETEFLLSRKRSAKEDRRAKDIRRVEGDPKPSVEDTILRVLAVRSFAFDFIAWQVEHEPRTRIERLVCHVISPTPDVNPVKEGRRSAVAEFVGCQSHFSDFKELAKRSIHIGIKHLVFELVVKHHLQQLGLPSSCEAISALLAWNIQNFRVMRYEEMPALIRGLLSHKVPSLASSNLRDNSDEEQNVLSLLCSLTPWFNLLQADYQGRQTIPLDSNMTY